MYLSKLKPVLGAALSFSLLFSIVAPPYAQCSLWSERKAALTAQKSLASLSEDFNSAGIMGQSLLAQIRPESRPVLDKALPQLSESLIKNITCSQKPHYTEA